MTARMLSSSETKLTQVSLSNALGVAQSTASDYMRKLRHIRFITKDGSKWAIGPNYKKYLRYWGVDEQGL